MVADNCAVPTARLEGFSLITGQPSAELPTTTAEPGETLTIADAQGTTMAVTAENGRADRRRSILFNWTVHIPDLPAGYAVTAILGPVDRNRVMLAATNPQGQQVIVFDDPDEHETVMAPTRVTASTPGTWAFTGDAAISAAGYAVPQQFTDGSHWSDPQSAPLTIVREPQYSPNQAGSAPMTTMTTPSPCRQGSRPQNHVQRIGGGLLIWCTNPGLAFSDELFAIS